MRANEFTTKTFDQMVLECLQSEWSLVEDLPTTQIIKSSLFDRSLSDKIARYPGLQDKINQFLIFKKTNPSQPWGGSDAPFVSNGPIGRALPKLRHAHLNRDISLFYTIEGRDPTVIKLYGVFSHQDSGTGTPSNINKQKSLVKKLVNV
jgi:hypothetical protein